MKYKPSMGQNKEIAEFLRAHRNRRGMTQLQVAQNAEICLRLYSCFENCERCFITAQFKTVMAVLDALGIDAKTFAEKYVGGAA